MIMCFLTFLLVIWHHGCQLMANTCLHSHIWLDLFDKTPTTVRECVCVCMCTYVTMYKVVYGYPDKPEPTTIPQTGFVVVGAEMC